MVDDSSVSCNGQTSEDKFELLERGKNLAAEGKFTQSFEYLERCCSLFAADRDTHLKDYLRSHYMYAGALLDYCQSRNEEGLKNSESDLSRKRHFEDGNEDTATEAKQAKLEAMANGQHDQKDDLSHHMEFLKEVDSLLENDVNSDDAIDDDSQSEASNLSDQSEELDRDEKGPVGSLSDPEKDKEPSDQNNEASSSRSNERSSENPYKTLLHKSISCLQTVCNVLEPFFNVEQSENVLNAEERSLEEQLSRDFCIRLYGLTLYRLAVAKTEISETDQVEKIFDDCIKVLNIEDRRDHRRVSEVSFTAATVLKKLGKSEKARKLLESSIAEMKKAIQAHEIHMEEAQGDEKKGIREEIDEYRQVLLEIENYLSQFSSSEELKRVNESPCC